MIKGCSKKVIVVKDTGSDLFEEAYFIVKPHESARKSRDFLSEANRIIASRVIDNSPKRKKANSSLFWMISGFTIGALVSGTTVFFLL